MDSYRIKEHPILSIKDRPTIVFDWQGRPFNACQGETIAAAFFANGIRTFGHHSKDGAPQGIFCANGQCSQCMVLADGRPVKACMTAAQPGMHIAPMDELPTLPQVDPCQTTQTNAIAEFQVAVLIIGGGPAGLAAAIELGQQDIQTLLVDDKHRLGGKLVLQTHRFFGSTGAVYAGTRGIDIAARLEEQVRALDSVEIWLNSTAVAVFSDKKVGILRESGEKGYTLIRPQVLLVATGAREKSLVFKGNTLPGVYGAGAFQTLVNRDLVRAAERLFIVGGGNVGLIAGYHALQTGIQVVGLVEALPECGGYKVHKDKLARLGVPIYTSHTVLSANGAGEVESVTIAQVGEQFHPLPGTERTFACDTVLIAVGLDPVNEFYRKAQEFGLAAFAAGDAQEIAEASAAMMVGKIRGLEIARQLGHENVQIRPEWSNAAEILKSRPGKTMPELLPQTASGVRPIIHCVQEIPCNPCGAVCPRKLIHIDESDIRRIPVFLENGSPCSGCERCIVACPGLAITLVDYRQDAELATVTIPYEFLHSSVTAGDRVTVTDMQGNMLGSVPVVSVRAARANDHTLLVHVQAPAAYARQIAGIQRIKDLPEPNHAREGQDGKAIVCRCERVMDSEIRDLIRKGCRDINEIKAVTRAGMGACGGKTCTTLIHRLFREEGVAPDEIAEHVQRPLFVEAPLGVFAGLDDCLNGKVGQ